jgi:chromosome segregation ATPase
MDWEKANKQKMIQAQGVERLASGDRERPRSEVKVEKRNRGRPGSGLWYVKEGDKLVIKEKTPEERRQRALTREISEVQRKLQKSCKARNDWNQQIENAHKKIKSLQGQVTKHSKNIAKAIKEEELLRCKIEKLTVAKRSNKDTT